MSYTGLQQHSKGAHYPWAVVGVGDKWQAQNLLNEACGLKRNTVEQVQQDIADFRQIEADSAAREAERRLYYDAA